MAKINVMNYKKIIREDRKRHVDDMNVIIDKLKDGKGSKETRENLAETAKGMLATNAVLEDTNCHIESKVGEVKGLLNAIGIGAVGYGVGRLIGYLITKTK